MASFFQHLTLAALGVNLGLLSFSVLSQQVMPLTKAIELAQQNDPWLQGNKLKQAAINARSIASGTYADPKVSIGMVNLPTDTWETHQEAMTQLKVGVSQLFPRGDEHLILQSQLNIESQKFDHQRADRKAMLTAKVSQLWLDAYLAQQTISLINNDKALFEQMTDIAKASYSTGVGKTRQQDVIRAQLEVVQLEDRLTKEHQAFDSAIAQLNEWLHGYDPAHSTFSIDFDVQPINFSVSKDLPVIELAHAELFKRAQFSRNQLAQVIAEHPLLQEVDVKQLVANKGIDLAQQQYKPQWGINASYAYRENMSSGQDRADLFSVGVTFDVPLFTGNRQDKQVAASIAQAQSVKTEKLLILKSMISTIEKEVRQLTRLSQRQALYQEQLLKQTHEQAEAALTAYTNDDGSFSEVVRARITELNTRISALEIDISALKTVARINYFFAHSPETTHVTSPQALGDK